MNWISWTVFWYPFFTLCQWNGVFDISLYVKEMLQNVNCFKLKLPLKRPRYIYLIVYIMFNICQSILQVCSFISIKYECYVAKLLKWYCIVYICTPNNIFYSFCFLYFIVFVQNSFGFISVISALSDVYRECPYKFPFKLNDFEKPVKRKEKQKVQFPISF